MALPSDANIDLLLCDAVRRTPEGKLDLAGYFPIHEVKLDASAPLPPDAYCEANANFGVVTMEGRKPGLELTRDGQPVAMRDWALELLSKIERTAATLDALRGDDVHMRSLEKQRAKFDDPSLTPSARVLQTMRDRQQGFLAFALASSEAHAEYFRSQPLAPEVSAAFTKLAAQSLAQQDQLERDGTDSLEEVIRAYRMPVDFVKSKRQTTGAAEIRVL